MGMARDAKRPQSRLEAVVLACLRERMKEKGIRQYRLAEMVGLSKGQLADIFNGRKPATFTEMNDIATAVGAALVHVIADAEAGRCGSSARIPLSAQVDAMILDADLEVRRAGNNHGASHPNG